MNLHRIFIGLGGLVLVGGVYLLIKSRQKSNGSTSGSTSNPSNSTDVASADSNDATTKQEGVSGDDSSIVGTNIKDLRGAEKRMFRKETRDVCRDKYGKGKDFRDCKKRVKSGGLAFTGYGFAGKLYFNGN